MRIRYSWRLLSSSLMVKKPFKNRVSHKTFSSSIQSTLERTKKDEGSRKITEATVLINKNAYSQQSITKAEDIKPMTDLNSNELHDIISSHTHIEHSIKKQGLEDRCLTDSECRFEPFVVFSNDRTNEPLDEFTFPKQFIISKNWDEVSHICDKILSTQGETYMNSKKNSYIFIDIGLRKMDHHSDLIKSIPSSSSAATATTMPTITEIDKHIFKKTKIVKDSKVKDDSFIAESSMSQQTIPSMTKNTTLPPYEYILFGNYHTCVLILHGYPKNSEKIASFFRILKCGTIVKLGFGPTVVQGGEYRALFFGVRPFVNLPSLFQLFKGGLYDISIYGDPCKEEDSMLNKCSPKVILPQVLEKMKDFNEFKLYSGSDTLSKAYKMFERFTFASQSTLTKDQIHYIIKRFVQRLSLFRNLVRAEQSEIWKLETDIFEHFQSFYKSQMR